MKNLFYIGIALILSFSACNNGADQVHWEGYRFTFIHDNEESKTANQYQIIYYNYLSDKRTTYSDSLTYRMPPASEILHASDPIAYALYLGSPGDTISIERFKKQETTENYDIDSPIVIEDIVGERKFAERQIIKALGLSPDSLLTHNQLSAARKLVKHREKIKEKLIHVGGGTYLYFIDRGSQDVPREGELMAIYYIAMLEENAQIIRNSFKMNEPMIITAGTSDIIDGWQNALQYIPLGSRVILFIPADQAYGSKGKGKIPADSDMAFLIDVY